MKKIIKMVKKYKLLVFLFLVLLLLLGLRLVLSKKEAVLELEKPLPLELEKETIVPEEETDKKPSLLEPKEKLQLLSIYPQPGENKTFSNQYKIVFTFNQPLRLDNLNFKIKPDISLKPSVENQQLNFYPLKPFSSNINYFLEISSLESTSGAKLIQPINYQFKIIFPEKIIFKEDH